MTTTSARPLRAMWLLNHSSARPFEVGMLKRLGIREIFLPKRMPPDPGFRSASVDWSEDANLTIPAADLERLNQVEWYKGATSEDWVLADRYFDIVFFILHHPGVIAAAEKHFSGAMIWRAYGLDAPHTYARTLAFVLRNQPQPAFARMAASFYFGEAFAHLADQEPSYLRERRCYLPAGLHNAALNDVWQGAQRQIYFVCPDIGLNDYYRSIYDEFHAQFGDLPYVIGGAQPIAVDDPRVLGFVPQEQHARNMQQSRLMFYHSREPNHIHYHPFEAVRAGLPLVFMSGGILDRLGGERLPGRCRTPAEARRKIERLLDNDRSLIESIRATQPVLLNNLQPEHCEPAWRAALQRIVADLTRRRAQREIQPQPRRRKRIAVILPIAYRGGTLRGARLLAEALQIGSVQSGDGAEVVLAHPRDPDSYPDHCFADLPPGVTARPFHWRMLAAAEARRAVLYAGFADWQPDAPTYMAPDDGIHNLEDCDLWLFVSDRLSVPVLPLKPMVLLVYDYLQRYAVELPPAVNEQYLRAAHAAQRVLVTTDFTRRDALQYAGLEADKVRKVPLLAPLFNRDDSPPAAADEPYFLWATSAAPHKNHALAAEALQLYYEEFDGRLDCCVTGVDTLGLRTDQRPHLKAMADRFERSQALRRRVLWKGELADAAYRRQLAGARFLWHPARVDNGTFTAIEAASLGVPALSSDYPAMREIEAQYALNLLWMDARSAQQMARQLKRMELEAGQRRALLPTPARLDAHRLEHHANAYWQEIRACL